MLAQRHVGKRSSATNRSCTRVHTAAEDRADVVTGLNKALVVTSHGKCRSAEVAAACQSVSLQAVGAELALVNGVSQSSR